MQHKQSIMIVDDEESIRYTFQAFLSDEGYDVVTARSFEEAVSCVDRVEFDLIFADIVLGGRTGIDFMREIRGRNMTTPVVMVTGDPSIETASEALRLGAFDYIAKPVNQNTLLHVTTMALKHKAIMAEKEQYRMNLEAIFRSVKDPIITVDEKLTVVELNHAAEKVFGLGRDAIGRHFSELSIPCRENCSRALIETIEKKQPVELVRMECRHRGGQGTVLSLSTSPLLDHKGLFSGAVVVIRDETRIADLERDLRERRQFHNIIGKSRQMQEVYTLIENLADVQTTVLISGESGTGKELVAEAIHYKGVRKDMPLVKVSCSALSESLLESELFGHVRGAFTGAVKDKTGRFQRADGGTIFLDEIGDISPRTQLQMLRVLQEMEFERVGDSSPVRVDVRVIAATNRDLAERVRSGEFREDLYYRLKVIELALPPLRERTDDIPILLEHFIGKFNQRLGRNIAGVSAEVSRLCMEYPWPGNIREFEHALEHGFILCRQSTITLDHLPKNIREFRGDDSVSSAEGEEDERARIISSLEKAGGNKARAARLLNIDRKTLYRKLEKYSINGTLSD